MLEDWHWERIWREGRKSSNNLITHLVSATSLLNILISRRGSDTMSIKLFAYIIKFCMTFSYLMAELVFTIVVT